VKKLLVQLQQSSRGNALSALMFWGLVVYGLGLPLPARALVILQYHHISEETPAATSISPSRFEAHLEAIAASGYQVLHLTTVTQLLRGGEPLPDKSVLITFDDGYSSIFEFAFPLLQQRGWPFVIFTNTEPVDLGWSGFSSWEQLRQMSTAGAAIANHSVSHPHMVRRLDGENEDSWRQRMSGEILDAERRIKQEIGHSHRVFAYPYGEANAALEALLDELDFIGMRQNSGAASRQQRLALPRFAFGGVYGDLEDFSLKLNTLPLPLEAVGLAAENGDPLTDGVLPPGVERPQVSLQLQAANLLGAPQCYVSGQGAATRQPGGDNTMIFQAEQPIRIGRSRYNCTANSAEPGRFHWFSVSFIRRYPDGRWPEEP
jgi:peptidoglycan/xylan/chitin deacetylase (PgdA/CDA1 family)